MLIYGAQGEPSGFDALAAIGAATGVLALLWNILSAVMRRERIGVSYHTYDLTDSGRTTSIVAITVTNVGRIPASLTSLATASHLPLAWRAPVLGSMTYRTRRRLHLFKNSVARTTNEHEFEPPHRLEPGEIYRHQIDIDAREATETAKWAVAQTGIARYSVPLVDNRERGRRHAARLDEAD